MDYRYPEYNTLYYYIAKKYLLNKYLQICNKIIFIQKKKKMNYKQTNKNTIKISFF